jgi:hypothetical protein
MVYERWLLNSPGFRPEPRKLARHLWGNVDYDSDGNSDIDPNWTELTLTRRPEYDERVDVDPISRDPLVLEISSQTPELALKAAEYLQKSCGGTLSRPK